MRDRYHKLRAEYMKDKVCMVCGAIDRLEIHHKNPNDKVKHIIWFLPYLERMTELETCEVRCKKCHDAIRRSAHLTGETNPNSKLNWIHIKEIRYKHRVGASYKLLAEEYGVAVKTIWQIINYQTWIKEGP